MNDPAEFSRFLAAMPVSLQASLQSGDNASTAFFRARLQGWTEEQLTHDAISRARGGKMGAGWVIEGLRGLAKNPPIKEVRKPVERWRPAPREVLPQVWIDERSALLRKIRADKVDGEQPARMMDDLILSQRGKVSTRDPDGWDNGGSMASAG